MSGISEDSIEVKRLGRVTGVTHLSPDGAIQDPSLSVAEQEAIWAAEVEFDGSEHDSLDYDTGGWYL